MDSHEKPKRLRRLVIAFAVYIAALPILYPASEGPAVYALRRGWFDAGAFMTIYRPWHRFASTLPPVSHGQRQWSHWWAQAAGPISN